LPIGIKVYSHFLKHKTKQKFGRIFQKRSGGDEYV